MFGSHRGTSSLLTTARAMSEGCDCAGAEHSRQTIGRREPEPCGALHRAKPFRQLRRNALGSGAVFEMAEMLDQRPGVNVHGTGDGAGAVARTGLNGVVVVVGEEPSRHGRAFGLPRHLPPQRDALPRRGRQIAARTHRLAIAALDTSIDGRLDDRRGLEVVEMAAGILGQDDPR